MAVTYGAYIGMNCAENKVTPELGSDTLTVLRPGQLRTIYYFDAARASTALSGAALSLISITPPLSVRNRTQSCLNAGWLRA